MLPPGPPRGARDLEHVGALHRPALRLVAGGDRGLVRLPGPGRGRRAGGAPAGAGEANRRATHPGDRAAPGQRRLRRVRLRRTGLAPLRHRRRGVVVGRRRTGAAVPAVPRGAAGCPGRAPGQPGVPGQPQRDRRAARLHERVRPGRPGLDLRVAHGRAVSRGRRLLRGGVAAGRVSRGPSGRPVPRDGPASARGRAQRRSKRSRFITLLHAATKSCTSLGSASSHA